ncbi:MAG TPA: DUF4412 domain-containing protein [Balneolales bacterium]|nr:DUF4412 domain-containing protein [Balneolales bacterium]
MKLRIRSSFSKQLLLLTLVSSALFLPAQLFAQKTFQGIVTFKLDAQGNSPNSFTYYLKGDKARMEMEMPAQAQMGKAAFIIDGGKREMITLIPQMKMYMQMQMSPVDSTGDNGKADDGEKPVKVGDTEVILGHKCDHWRINDEDGGTVDLWNAKGFGNFMMPGSMSGMPGGGRQPQWIKDMMSQGFFPLKVVVTKKDGSTEMSMVATKIEEKDLSSSLFEVPSGYNKMNIPNMGNMGRQN